VLLEQKELLGVYQRRFPGPVNQGSPASTMVKLGALALGLLSLTAEVCGQKVVKIMPFGASIVSVSFLGLQLML
jgi:hypothetical protein